MISAEIGFADSGLLEIAGPKAETKKLILLVGGGGGGREGYSFAIALVLQ